MRQTRHINRCGFLSCLAACITTISIVISPAAGTDDAATASGHPAQAASPAQARMDGLLSKITRIESDVQSSSHSSTAAAKHAHAAELSHVKALRKALLEVNGAGWKSVMTAADRATQALVEGGRVMVVITEPGSAQVPTGLASLHTELLHDAKGFTPGVFELIGTGAEREKKQVVGPNDFLFVLGGDVPVRSADKGTFYASLQKLVNDAGGVCYIAPASGVKAGELQRQEMVVDSILDSAGIAEMAVLSIIKTQVMHDVAQNRPNKAGATQHGH